MLNNITEETLLFAVAYHFCWSLFAYIQLMNRLDRIERALGTMSS